MATYNTSVSVGGGEDIADLTSGSVSPSGTNRFIFGSVLAGGFSGVQDPTVMRFGGSGGTAMTQIGADQSVGFEAGSNIWGYAPGPSGSTTIYADWAGTAQTGALAALFYEGVNQTTPYNTSVQNSGSFEGASSTTGVASVTVTGCTVGQTVVASVRAFPDSNNLAAFSAVSGTTIRVQQLDNLSTTFMGLALLEKVATGSSETLEVNVNLTSGSGEAFWVAAGIELNNESSGNTLVADSGSYSLTGQAAGVLYPRTVAAEQGSYGLTGQDVTLVKSGSYSFTADSGSYTLIGSAALIDVSMNAEQGSYTLTGQDATLTYTQLTNRTLTAEQGSYALTGQIVLLQYGRIMPAEQGSYTLTGQQVGLTWSGAPTSTGYIVKRMSISALKIGL